jgi:APA family basic amino acid/polyamine antiporter
MIVAGSMIGSGIFIVSADIARQVGAPGWLLVVWIITGLLTIVAALSYGELVALFPNAGGQYVYLREAHGPLWGFLYGWTLFLVIQTGTIATGAYFDLPAVVITAIITVILVIGIRASAGFNAGMVIVKLAIVLFVIAVGVFYIDAKNCQPFAPFGYTGVSFFGKTLFGQTGLGGEPLGVLAGAAIIFFAYIGFDSVSTHAEEAKRPQRDVPIGIIASFVRKNRKFLRV